MGQLITAAQAAERLRIDVRTLYAYVSRGSLRRAGSDPRRRSLYDSADVELLAQHGRPRSGAGSRAGVEVVIGSSVSAIGDGWIRYRHTDPIELARSGATFEQAAAILWADPPQSDVDELRGSGSRADRSTTRRSTVDPAAARGSTVDWSVPTPVRRRVARALSAVPPDAGTLPRMMVALAVAAAHLDVLPARALVGTLVEAVEAVEAARVPTGQAPPTELAGRLWTRLSPLVATPARVALLNRTLILLAEHELATSTLAVRVATSTRAPLANAVIAGLATFSGPAHGGVATLVHRQLLDHGRQAKPADPPPPGHPSTPDDPTHQGHRPGPGHRPPPGHPSEPGRRPQPGHALTLGSARQPDHRSAAGHPTQPVADGSRPGFGHPVHEHGDPRAQPILDGIRRMASPSSWSQIDQARRAGETQAPATVDFALGSLCYVSRMRPGAAEAIFAIARSVGWIAHAAEESAERPVRFRARTVFRTDPPR